MTMTEQKRKRGRPKGSTNKPKPSQAAEPVRCPNCDCTEYSRAWPICNIKENGTTPNGKPYDRLISSVKACKNCDTEFVVHTWRYHGDFCEGDPVDPYSELRQ